MRTLGIFTAALVAGLWACAPDADMEEMDTEPPAGTEDDLVSDEELTDAGGVPQGLGEYDRNEDRGLDREEFGEWSRSRSATAGTGLDRDRFSQRVVLIWDSDDDDLVDEDEWREGLNALYGDGDHGVWADWDGDGDSELDANEVAEALETKNLYDRVDLDRDALIDDEELADWFFDVIDLNDDDVVDTTEWDSASASGYFDSL